MENNYVVCINSNGEQLEDCSTYQKALDIIKEYELSDKMAKEYERGYYDIYNVATEYYEKIDNL